MHHIIEFGVQGSGFRLVRPAGDAPHHRVSAGRGCQVGSPARLSAFTNYVTRGYQVEALTRLSAFMLYVIVYHIKLYSLYGYF
jgi:hypothetical protein